VWSRIDAGASAGSAARRWRLPAASAVALAAAIASATTTLMARETAMASATALAPAAGADGNGDSDRCSEPLCYTASSLEAERNRVVLHDIDIIDTTRGTTNIRADLAEASGLDLGNSQWVLTGHVHVSMPQGQLSADRATVKFVDKRIASMTAHGAPAEFEHATGSGHDGAQAGAAPPARPGTAQSIPESAHGHARDITFDMDRDELQLNGDSWLTDGCSEISSQHITYDIASQRVQADAAPGDSTRVHGTIRQRTQVPCGSTVGQP
jgi:lipopolysaccharide export system protein LptA